MKPRATRRLPGPLLVGLTVWLAALFFLPSPLAARILLLAPLVVVPRLIVLLPQRRWVATIGWPSLAVALPLLLAFSLPPGPLAAVFVVPWLGAALIGLWTP